MRLRIVVALIAVVAALLPLAAMSLPAAAVEYEFGIVNATEPCNDKWCVTGGEPYYELVCDTSQWTWCEVRSFQCGPNAICTECFSYDCAY